MPDGPGAFYPPTLLTNVSPGNARLRRRGLRSGCLDYHGAGTKTTPSASRTIRAYGLGAAVFTQDRAKGEQIAAEKLQAGNCFVNAFVKSDPRLPFGGIKNSGYGRELSKLGIHEFVNIKTVYIA